MDRGRGRQRTTRPARASMPSTSRASMLFAASRGAGVVAIKALLLDQGPSPPGSATSTRTKRSSWPGVRPGRAGASCDAPGVRGPRGIAAAACSSDRSRPAARASATTWHPMAPTGAIRMSAGSTVGAARPASSAAIRSSAGWWHSARATIARAASLERARRAVLLLQGRAECTRHDAKLSPEGSGC